MSQCPRFSFCPHSLFCLNASTCAASQGAAASMGGSMGNSVGGGLAMSLEGQAGFSPSEFMAGTPPNWSDPSMAQVEQNFPLVSLLAARARLYSARL